MANISGTLLPLLVRYLTKLFPRKSLTWWWSCSFRQVLTWNVIRGYWGLWVGPQLHVMSLPRSDGNCEAGFDSAGSPICWGTGCASDKQMWLSITQVVCAVMYHSKLRSYHFLGEGGCVLRSSVVLGILYNSCGHSLDSLPPFGSLIVWSFRRGRQWRSFGCYSWCSCKNDKKVTPLVHFL